MESRKTGTRLTSTERDFLTLINRSVLANPFSEEREHLDAQIAGVPGGASQSEAFEASLRETIARMETFEADGRADINLFAGKDRLLVEYAFLYHFFYEFRSKVDQLILEQIQAGKKPLKVPFAREAWAFLLKRGFRPADVKRYVELAYQIRRAFYFIDQNLVGCSAGMRALRRKLWNNVFTHDLLLYHRYLWDRMEDFSTLILGETGSGKGTAAAAIGRSGFIPYDEKSGCFVESFTDAFVSLNLSQFPESLIESELFGHKKGAFTGAVEDYQGILDRCSPHGAIFLDEIGDVSIPLQIKLLQVLQERVYSPVGSHDPHRFQGRVIAATNRPIDDLRQSGAMRDDFYYRLCSDVIIVPPLRDRLRQDARELDALLDHTVRRILGQASPDIVTMVRKVIDQQLGESYPWPGNVRELEQCVRQVLLNKTYTGDQRPAEQGLVDRLVRSIREGDMPAQQLLAGYCRLIYEQAGSYEAVSRRVGLDRRTVKKYIDGWEDGP